MRAGGCRTGAVQRRGAAQHRLGPSVAHAASAASRARRAPQSPLRVAPPWRAPHLPPLQRHHARLRRSVRPAATTDDGAEEALGRALLLGVAAAYGSLTVACRYVFLLPGPPAPSVMSAVRGVVAVVCFAPLLVDERRSLGAAPRSFWAAAAELTLYNSLYEGLLNLSVVHTDATRAAFLFESSVLFTPALVAASGARVAPSTWAAAAAAACGVTLLASDSLGTPSSAGLALTAGDAEALAAALAYSCYVLRMGSLGATDQSPELTQGVKCILMAAVYLGWAGVDVALAAGAGARSAADLSAALWPGVASGAAWAALLYSGAVPGALADVLQARGQARVSAAEAQVLLAAEPLWTAVLGAAALHEHMSSRDWAGAALIVGALAVSSGLWRRLKTTVRREWRGQRGLDAAEDAVAVLEQQTRPDAADREER